MNTSRVAEIFCCIAIFCVAIIACNSRQQQVKAEQQKTADVPYQSPPGYNLLKPVIIKLPIELNEISGIDFYAKDSGIFAINDEIGLLYKIFLRGNEPVIEKWKFSSSGDFEDIVMHEGKFYVLKSNGNIFIYTLNDNEKTNLQQVDFPVKKNEFESLYYDSVINKLVLICKDCDSDKKKFLTTYSFNMQTNQFAENNFRINVKKIDTLTGMQKIKLKPSAATLNPLTGQLFIISSINKLLVLADKNGNPESSYFLNPVIFKQPEGITFTPWGTMIISNEAADIGVAELLVYKYNPKTN
jgi:uncharacterized protein YjiK